MWDKGFGLNHVIAAVSRDRFVAILKFLQFDDCEERPPNDVLAPIRKLWKQFVETCCRSIIASELSTMHKSDEVYADFDNKPEAILDYNSLKCLIDVLDQMASAYRYTTRKKVRRWPVTLFANLLDMEAINAYVTWIKRHPQ